MFKTYWDTKQASIEQNQQPLLQKQQMQNKRSQMQNQQSCTDELTREGVQRSFRRNCTLEKMYPEENVTLNSRERFHARIQNSSGVSHGERVGVRRIFRFARGVCVCGWVCVWVRVCVYVRVRVGWGVVRAVYSKNLLCKLKKFDFFRRGGIRISAHLTKTF